MRALSGLATLRDLQQHPPYLHLARAVETGISDDYPKEEYAGRFWRLA